MGEFVANFDEDPAAEFLAREKDELADLVDDVKPTATTPPVGLPIDVASSDIFNQENGDSFELINGIENLHTTDDNIYDNEDLKRNGVATPPRYENREEPEKIKKWREEQKTRLEEKDKQEEIKKDELRALAKKELEDWYKHHEEQIAKTKIANRNAEKQFVAEDNEIEPGTEWERIAKLCDFNPKASKGNKDVSRMRSIILQLKQTPIATKRN